MSQIHRQSCDSKLMLGSTDSTTLLPVTSPVTRSLSLEPDLSRATPPLKTRTRSLASSESIAHRLMPANLLIAQRF